MGRMGGEGGWVPVRGWVRELKELEGEREGITMTDGEDYRGWVWVMSG